MGPHVQELDEADHICVEGHSACVLLERKTFGDGVLVERLGQHTRHVIEDLRQLVELDVRRAWIELQDALAKIQSERGNVALAQEGLRLAVVRFQEEVGTQAETLDAELALTNAETSLAVALHDYAVAHAALEKAAGMSWATDN